MKPTKKMITESVDSIKYSLDGRTLEDAITYLKGLAKVHGKEAKLDIGQECEPYSYSDVQYAYVRVNIQRLETDEEYEKRKAQEQQWADQRKAADLEAYERVKKSLEGK